MAWQAPRTWVVGELVTAAMMNQDVRDNTNYLKTAIETVTVTERGYAMATNYQNTTDKVVICCVSADVGAIGLDTLLGKIGVASPAATVVAQARADGSNEPRYIQITFVIPVNYFYRLDDGAGDFAIVEWIEYEMH